MSGYLDVFEAAEKRAPPMQFNKRSSLINFTATCSVSFPRCNLYDAKSSRDFDELMSDAAGKMKKEQQYQDGEIYAAR